MSLTTYCDFDEVRSSLGVNDTELKNTVLDLPVYEMGLVRELNRLSSSLIASYTTVYLKTPATRTTEEAGLYDAVRLFSVYAVARQVGVSLANFAPKDVGDGKATVSRYSGEPFEKVMSRVEEYYFTYKADLGDAYDTYAGAATARAASTTPITFVGKSARSYDPVTGA